MTVFMVQPDGKYAVFQTISDNFSLVNAETLDEVIDHILQSERIALEIRLRVMVEEGYDEATLSRTLFENYVQRVVRTYGKKAESLSKFEFDWKPENYEEYEDEE